MRLAGKSALITGAANGVGRASALLFAAEGASVTAVDVDTEGISTLVEEIRSDRGQAVAAPADVSVPDQIAETVVVAESTFGQLDVLFNNAGIMCEGDAHAESTSEAAWDRTLQVNLKGAWLACRYALPALRRAGGGSVINMSSIVALVGSASSPVAYTASKGGVLALTRELAVRHARDNIRVNALCPGPLRTGLLGSVLHTTKDEERRLDLIPLGRFGEAEDVAQAALWLASDDAGYVTGASLVVDGGLSATFVPPEIGRAHV